MDHEKLPARRVSEELREFRKKINKCLSDAQAFVDDQPEFSWSRFIRDFINQHPSFLKRKLKEEVAPEGESVAESQHAAVGVVVSFALSFRGNGDQSGSGHAYAVLCAGESSFERFF